MGCSLILRWDVPSSTWPLSSSHGGTDGSHSQSVCPHGGPRRRHHGDGAAGGDVPGVAGAHRVSALSASHRHSHLPRRGAHEHAAVPLLLLCGVSGVRAHAEPRVNNHLQSVCAVLFRCDLGCCLIPCLIDDLKDVTHTCPNCKGYIYTYKRIC